MSRVMSRIARMLHGARAIFRAPPPSPASRMRHARHVWRGAQKCIVKYTPRLNLPTQRARYDPTIGELGCVARNSRPAMRPLPSTSNIV